jgi:hypothetical protein
MKLTADFTYSSVVDTNTDTFNDKTYAYKESNGVFFKKKDFELSDTKPLQLQFKLLQNFETSRHLLGLMLEAPLTISEESETFGDSEPNCDVND